MSWSMRRFVAALCISAVGLPAGAAHAEPCWRPPVSAPIVDPFREPGCRWCAGNRGLDYGTSRGVEVHAVGTGVVSWAGSVAGTVYVVVRHGDGRRVTYGNLTRARLAEGDRVVRGQVVGVTAGRLYFGVREGDRYVDPARFLGRTVYAARLIPLDGLAAHPPSRPRLVCAR